MHIRQNFADSTSPKPALYVCSTPIGNLGDVSVRLLDTLRSADVVAAEDTRHTRKLLSRFDIHPKVLVSCHEHNQAARMAAFTSWWAEGKVVALVSDAGTPAVSDPGWFVVDAAIEQGIPVIPIPGASAVLAALVGSRLPMQPFAFFGFLPRGKSDAQQMMKQALQFPGTTIFYEAPHRLLSFLKLLCELAPERAVTVAKELTKTHETFIDGAPEDILRYMTGEGPRGEYVVLIGPAPVDVDSPADLESAFDEGVVRVRSYQDAGMSHANAVRQVSEEIGVKRRELYQRTLSDADSGQPRTHD